MKVLLVDDHALFRRGLRLMLREIAMDMDVTEAEGCPQALRLSHEPFDLILLDMNMPGISGLEAVRCIKQAWTMAFVVVLSGEESPNLIREAIDGGASGFIPKASTPEVMVSALQVVLANGIYLPIQVLMSDKNRPTLRQERTGTAKDIGMTDRQIDVLRLALKGIPNKLIAREIGIAEGTVKSHLSTTFRLLNVRNRTEAVYRVASLGINV